jgi:DNA processing protein
MTVVVAPAGFLAPFPSHHRGLFDRVVAAGGAYLSLVPDHQTATRAAFFSRNACLAALSHAVVIVEGSFRSGARNTTRWARQLGRPFFAVPAAPWHKRGGGCLIELRLGARLCTHARDVLEVLEESGAGPLIPVMPPEPQEEPRQACAQVPLPFPERPQTAEGLVLDAVRRGARNIDEICDLSGLGAAVVQRHVLTLTLEGALAPDPAGALAQRLPPNLVSPHKLLKSIEEKGDCDR